MPKLDVTHIVKRLNKRLAELRNGDVVAARDVRALLTPEQETAMDAAWGEQQALRKKKRARTKEEEAALGWKNIRQIQIAAYEAAVAEANVDELEAWKKKQRDAEVKQGRILFDELSKQMNAGVDASTAKIRANNALTRAGLQRMDGSRVGAQRLSKRDAEIQAMETAIVAGAHSAMTADELEQLYLVQEHEKTVLGNRKKTSI